MNFIETIFESIQHGIDQLTFSIESGIDADDIDRYNWIIGSGSDFQLYLGLSHKKAYKIFNNLSVRQCCGKKISSKHVGYNYLESYYAMESDSGVVYLFMIEASSDVFDERDCPNDNLDKFNAWRKEKYGHYKQKGSEEHH